MGWISNIFKSKALLYIEQMYKDCKELNQEQKEKIVMLETDIKQLYKNNFILKEQVLKLQYNNKFNTNNNDEQFIDIKKVNINKIKLTKKEKEIYNFVGESNNLKELSELTNMEIPSIRTYCSRIRKKGYTIDWEN